MGLHYLRSRESRMVVPHCGFFYAPTYCACIGVGGGYTLSSCVIFVLFLCWISMTTKRARSGPIQSAGGIVYVIDHQQEPRYLLIKRQAMSKKIERVAPKWKLEKGETMKEAAVREVWEETGLMAKDLAVWERLGKTYIRSKNVRGWWINKDITRYLMHYVGDVSDIELIDGEGYVGVYKRCTLQEVLALIYYPDLRELIRSSYDLIKQKIS